MLRKRLAIQPAGVFTEMPMPLSSQTNSTGAGSFWYAVHAAALNAVCAVAWLAEASPNEQIAMLSSGIGSAWPRRLPASMATAVPSALGRCEAIVEVCGSTHNGLLPHTLCRPPLSRVVLAGGEAQRRIHDRIHARQLAEALGHEAAGAVMQERRIGVARQARDHRVAFVAAGADRVEDLVLHAQHARHQVEVAADQLRFEQLEEAARVAARCRRGSASPGAGRASAPAVPVACTNSTEIVVADLGAVEAFHAGGDRIGHGGLRLQDIGTPLAIRRSTGSEEDQSGRAMREALRTGGGGIATKPGVARRAQPGADRGYGVRSNAAVVGDVGVGEQRDVGDAVGVAAEPVVRGAGAAPSPPAPGGRARAAAAVRRGAANPAGIQPRMKRATAM